MDKLMANSWLIICLYILFPVSVVVVDADEGAGKGEDFAEGDEHAAVYHPRRRNGDTCHQ